MLLNTCSSCNQPISNVPVEFPSTTTLPAEKQIASIVSETARLENIIAQLHAIRASRLQQLNALRSSTRNLPTEILSSIFHHYLPPINFDNFEFEQKRPPRLFRSNDKDKALVSLHAQVSVLGAVSRQWRTVTYGTPQLWEAAQISVRRDAIENKAQLVRLYLTNVGDAPFSLKLESAPHDTPVQVSPMSEIELQPIFHSIWERAEKIRRLVCTIFPSSWLGLLDNKFQKLDYLNLYQMSSTNFQTHTRISGPQVTSWSSITRLSKVALTGVRVQIPQESPPCNSITVLRMNLPDLVTCLHLLAICPNLIEYQVKPMAEVDSSTEPLPILPEQLTFPYMTNFQVHCALQWPFYDHFHRLNLPALETLGLGATARDARNEVSNLKTFIRSLPSSWSTLDLNYLFADSVGVVVQMLEAGIPENVSTLNLLFSDRANFRKILQILKVCQPPHQRVSFPGLKRICILHWQTNYHPLSLLGEAPSIPLPKAFLEMLRERRRVLNDKFLLEMEADSGVYWADYQGEFRELISEGFRVRIVVGGKLIPELQEVYEQVPYMDFHYRVADSIVSRALSP